MYYWLVIIPMTMKLCHRGMPTKTFNIHELQVCKQQQIASGTKSCKFIGERERANLVVQLARFFYIYIFVSMSPYRNLIRNSKYTSAKFHAHCVSRMRKYISYGSAVLLQLAGLRVVYSI